MVERIGRLIDLFGRNRDGKRAGVVALKRGAQIRRANSDNQGSGVPATAILIVCSRDLADEKLTGANGGSARLPCGATPLDAVSQGVWPIAKCEAAAWARPIGPHTVSISVAVCINAEALRSAARGLDIKDSAEIDVRKAVNLNLHRLRHCRHT